MLVALVLFSRSGAGFILQTGPVTSAIGRVRVWGKLLKDPRVGSSVDLGALTVVAPLHGHSSEHNRRPILLCITSACDT